MPSFAALTRSISGTYQLVRKYHTDTLSMKYSIFTCHKKKVFLLSELYLVSFHLFINVAHVLLKQLNKFVIQFFQTILAFREKLQQKPFFPFIFVFCL